MFYVPVSEPPIGAIPLGNDSDKDKKPHSKQVQNNSPGSKENSTDALLPQICDETDAAFDQSQKASSGQYGWGNEIYRTRGKLGDSVSDEILTKIQVCSVKLPPKNHLIEDEIEAPFFRDFDEDLPHPPPPFDTSVSCESGILPMNTPFPLDGMVPHVNVRGIGINIAVRAVGQGPAPEPGRRVGANPRPFRSPKDILFSESDPIVPSYRSHKLFDDSVAIPPPAPPKENIFD